MATETAPAFQFYVKEWRSSRPVMRMTYAQRGMYLEMLIEQWENLSLPDSADEVAEIIGGNVEEWRANWPVLRRNFLLNPDTNRITNTRLEKCRKDRRQYEKWSRKNARKGGLARSNSATRKEDGTYSPAQSPAHPSSDVQPASSLANQPNPASASASASASSPAVYVRPQPIVQKRRKDAAWEFGGWYVPQRAHDDLRGLHPPDFEPALFNFYETTVREWTTGSRKGHNPGADMIRFWKARHDEAWPPAEAVKPPPKAQGPTYVSAKDHPYAAHYTDELKPTGTEGGK